MKTEKALAEVCGARNERRKRVTRTEQWYDNEAVIIREDFEESTAMTERWEERLDGM